jgi:YbbR domain-containing protein
VSRFLGFILHNWPLKLAAVALATILYAGLVLSQNARVWPGRVPIQVLNQPSSAFMVGQLEDVANIRFFAPVAAADRLSSAAFTAWIDLENVTVDPQDPLVTVDVHLRVSDSSVDILDYRPRRITVRLDPVVSRTVPVQVAHGAVPEGLEPAAAELSQPTVSVVGPQSVVNQVVAAEARVRIQPSGIDVDQLVDLIAVDARGEQLTPVEIEPSSIRVRIEVSSDITTKTVPVAPVVSGQPAAGWALDATSAQPSVVTLSGNADVLATVLTAPTVPIPIDGASENVTTATALDLPDGVTAVGSPSVTVTITLRELEATRNLVAGLVLQGAEPDRTYTLGADSVTVTVGGTEAALRAIASSAFAATVDVTGLAEGRHEVPVRIDLPGDVRLVSVSAPQVAVFVSPRATPPPTPTPSPTPQPTPTPTPTPTPLPTTAPTGTPEPVPSESPVIEPSPTPPAPSGEPSPAASPSP